MKTLYGRHHQNLKIVSVKERDRYIGVLPKLAYFALKPCSRVLGYCAIDPKVCQEANVGRRQSLKTVHQRIYVYMINWRPLVGEYLQCVKEPATEVYTNAVPVFHTNSHCKGEVLDHVQQKFSWLHPCFYLCLIVFWTSLQPGKASIMEVNTDWKSQ